MTVSVPGIQGRSGFSDRNDDTQNLLLEEDEQCTHAQKSSQTNCLLSIRFQTSDSYRELSQRFSQLNPEALTVANKVYVSNKFRLQDAFTYAAQSYRSEVDTLDFSQAQQAADVINQWVST